MIFRFTLPRLTCKCENTENQGFMAFVYGFEINGDSQNISTDKQL